MKLRRWKTTWRPTLGLPSPWHVRQDLQDLRRVACLQG